MKKANSSVELSEMNGQIVYANGIFGEQRSWNHHKINQNPASIFATKTKGCKR